MVHPTMLEMFYTVIEETDNGVLYDHYQKVISDTPKPSGSPKRRK